MSRSALAGVLRRAVRPPLGNPRFWVVQGLVLVVAMMHALADLGLALPPFGIPHFATVTLFLVPIVYAALNFGLSGSLATAAWAALLSLPDLAFWDVPRDGWDDSVQLVVAVAVAVFVGQRVEREQLARRRAEDAEERAKSYAASILHGQEEERRRIAHELHDDPLQALIHLSRRLEALSERQALPLEARSEMAETQLLMTAAAVSLREIAQGLRPPSLDDLGLVPALRQLVAGTGEGDGLVVDFRVRGASRRLAPETELGLYRIAQEALRNVERHAAARHADLAIAFGSNEVALGVRDDGVGFDAALAGPRGSLGMTGMQERVALLGGELAVRSLPGRGTSVDVRIPCPAPVSRT